MDRLDWIGAGALLLAATPLASCHSGTTVGTDTGNAFDDGPTGGEVNHGGQQCEESESQALAFDESMQLGFSPEDMWALAAGVHEQDITWAPKGPVGVGSFADTHTVLRVELSRRGEGARLIESRENTSADVHEGPLLGGGNGGQTCPDRMEIDVAVSLSTADGALDETFDAVLRSVDGLGASWTVQLERDALQGALPLSVDDAPEGSELEHVQIEMTHSAYAHQGSLTAIVEGNDGRAAWQGVGELTRWPEGGGCEYGDVLVDREAPVFQFSAEDAFETLAAELPTELTWADGTSTSMTASLAWVEGGQVCAVTLPRLGERLSLTGEVLLTLATGDERVDLRLPLELYAEADEAGQLGTVLARRQAYLADTVPPEQFEAMFGITGVDLEGFDAAGLELDLRWEDSGTTGGSLAVLGGRVRECISSPGAEPVGDGVSGGSGACGVEYDEVETATF